MKFDHCKYVKVILSKQRILDLIDIAIFDYLIQNGDRHHYEVVTNLPHYPIALIDNGKRSVNPRVLVFFEYEFRSATCDPSGS